MRKIELNSEQLGLLSSAFLKNLFSRPLQGELLIDEASNEDKSTLYFDENYYNKLCGEFKSKQLEGSFARSNSEQDWLNLMLFINASQTTSDNVSNCTFHPFSIKPETKPITKIDINRLTNIINSERPTKNGWIGDIMSSLAEDLISVYIGYSIAYNWDGYLILEKEIDTESMFATKIELVPMLKLFEKYKVEISSFEIMKLINPDKINATIYLKN